MLADGINMWPNAVITINTLKTFHHDVRDTLLQNKITKLIGVIPQSPFNYWVLITMITNLIFPTAMSQIRYSVKAIAPDLRHVIGRDEMPKIQVSRFEKTDPRVQLFYIKFTVFSSVFNDTRIALTFGLGQFQPRRGSDIRLQKRKVNILMTIICVTGYIFVNIRMCYPSKH